MTSSMQRSLRRRSARVGDARARAPASHCTIPRRTDHPPNPGEGPIPASQLLGSRSLISPILVSLILAGGTGGLVSCTATGLPGQGGTHATLVGEVSERSAAGDWADLDAAVEVALESAEVAVIGSGHTPDRATYQLVSLEGRPGELVIARGESGRLTLSARIGRFGDPARERRLLDAVAGRLARLGGVDIAPLD